MRVRLKILYRRYVRTAFRKHALALNTASSGLLMWLGDLVQQGLEKPPAGLDWPRSIRMMLVGVMEGPLHHIYYTRLDRVLPGNDMRTVLVKIVLDQVIASPMFIATFFYGNGILEGRTLSETTTELRRDLWTVYMADWIVWPPTQFLNFYLVPGQYRVLYINGVTMMYNVFLSWIKHRDQCPRTT